MTALSRMSAREPARGLSPRRVIAVSLALGAAGLVVLVVTGVFATLAAVVIGMLHVLPGGH